MPESPEELRDRLAAGKTLRMVAEERARKFDGGDESRVQALMAENERLRMALSFAVSMIRSGERETPEASRVFDEAFGRNA